MCFIECSNDKLLDTMIKVLQELSPDKKKEIKKMFKSQILIYF